MPDRSHGRHVVKHMAFRLFHGPEIRRHSGRLHNHLAQQQNTRTDHLTNHPQHPHNGMYLRQIPAACAKLLPDIGHRVDPQHIYPVIGQIKQIVHHDVKYIRIRVIQIPLIRIECRHHVFPDILQPGKVAGSCGGEHLGAGLFILSGYIVAVKEEIPILILLFSRPGPPGPFVLLRGMVHDEIQAQTDAPPVALLRQLL